MHEAGEAERCDGSVLVRCVAGALLRTDCRSVYPGGPCPCGWAPCVAPGMHCEGDVLAVCDEGHLQRYQCDRWGLVCRDGTGCVDPCAGAQDSCDDGVIGYCRSGSPSTLDCRALGFSGCATWRDVDVETTRAYCTTQ